MTLNNYLQALRRAWLGALVIFLAGIALTTFLTVRAPKVYQSSAMGFVTSNITPNSGGDLQSINDVSAARAASYVDLASSTAIAADVQKQLGWEEDADTLLSLVTVSQPLDTVLINVDAKGSSPERAEVLANTWMEALSKQVQQIENPDRNGKSLRLQQVVKAEAPSLPILPNKRNNMVVGGVISLLAALTYAMWRGFRPGKLTSQEDFDTAELPLLAVMPASGNPEGERNGLRQVRTRWLGHSSANSAVVISALDADGQAAETAKGLAALTAATDRSVVLVDADLMERSVSQNLGLADKPGLTELLRGSAALSSVLVARPDLDGCLVLPAGAVADDSSELLASTALSDVLAELRAQFGAVVISSPPLDAGADSAILAREADSTILTLQGGSVTAAEARNASLALGEPKGFLGFVARQKMSALGRRHG